MDKLKLKRYSEIALSALIALLGIAFVFSACHLYATGGAVPYSRERVGEYLLWLLPLSIVVIAAVIFVGILSLGAGDGARVRSTLSELTLYKRRMARVDKAKLSPERAEILKREEKRRRLILISAAVLVSAYAAITLFVALDFSGYTVATCSEDVAALSLLLFPPAIVIVGFGVLASRLYEASLSRSSEAYKAEIDGGNADGASIDEARLITFIKKNEERIVLVARISIVLVAALFIVLGIFNDGMADVLGKAVKICTECIGLG